MDGLQDDFGGVGAQTLAVGFGAAAELVGHLIGNGNYHIHSCDYRMRSHGRQPLFYCFFTGTLERLVQAVDQAGGADGVFQEHGDGDGADAAGDWGDP